MDYPGINDPEILELRSLPAVSEGSRTDTVLKIMNAAGKSGFSNHEILAIGSELMDRWGLHPSAVNLYAHWTALLGMLRNVRRHYHGRGE